MSSNPHEGSPDPGDHRLPDTDGIGSSGSGMPAAGWYPTPTGGQRYWDGAQWLELPPPPESANPSPGASTVGAPGKARRTKKWVLISAAAVLVLGLIVGGIALKNASDTRKAEAAAASAASASAAAAASEEKAREDAAAAAQERADAAERASRLASVAEIEGSVKQMAEKHAADGIIDGPIISVTCSPVGGGSTDDLTQLTTVFSCFVADKDNGDGTLSGYTYNATMNWSTGSYTYGFGAP